MPTSIEAAISDPVGCRFAILEFGAWVGYPKRQYGPLVFGQGKEAWEKKITGLPPAILGKCWEAIESGGNGYETSEAMEESKESTERGIEMPVIEPTQFSTVEPGTYGAQIQDIQEETFTDAEGRTRLALKFFFLLLDADGKPLKGANGNPVVQWGWAGRAWSERSKLYRWAKAILRSKCPGLNEPLDTDLLLGKKCDIALGERTGPRGESRVAIEEVYPYRTMSIQEEDEPGVHKPTYHEV